MCSLSVSSVYLANQESYAGSRVIAIRKRVLVHLPEQTTRWRGRPLPSGRTAIRGKELRAQLSYCSLFFFAMCAWAARWGQTTPTESTSSSGRPALSWGKIDSLVMVSERRMLCRALWTMTLILSWSALVSCFYFVVAFLAFFLVTTFSSPY